MAQVSFNSFIQPASAGGIVEAQMVGDPVLVQDELVLFMGYGTYRVAEVLSDNSSLFRRYNLILSFRYSGSPDVVPTGTLAALENSGVSHSVLNYNPVIALSFRERDYRTLTLTGDITFNAQHHNPARAIVIKIRNSSGVTSRNLTFPPSWIFIGSSGRPSTIAPSRTGILSVTCFGTSDADVIAAWAAQA